MKRDMDLVRQLLLSLEENGQLGATTPTIDGFTADQVGYHAYLLVEAGLANGHDATTRANEYRNYVLTDLTNAGHDWLDAARDDTRWNQAKSIFAKMGGVTLDVAKDVLVGLLSQQVSQYTGGPTS